MLVYALLMVIDAILAVVVPYLLNKWNDPKTTVNWNTLPHYCSRDNRVLFGLPGKVDVYQSGCHKTAILAVRFWQGLINKLVKSYSKIKRKKDNMSLRSYVLHVLQ